MNLAVLGVSSSIGARNTGTENAPRALRSAGLLARLKASGHEVRDAGDQEPRPYVPDVNPAHRKLKNLDGLLPVLKTLASRVEAVLREERVPLVLGGDCTVALGSLAGAVRVHGVEYLAGQIYLQPTALARSTVAQTCQTPLDKDGCQMTF